MVSWWYAGGVLVVSWWYPGGVLVVCWGCWWCASGMLVCYWWYSGGVLVVCGGVLYDSELFSALCCHSFRYYCLVSFACSMQF